MLTYVTDMDVDQVSSKVTTKSKAGRGRVEKKRSSSRKASIVFPKYKNGKRVSRAGKS